jgi:hypothetical protein
MAATIIPSFAGSTEGTLAWAAQRPQSKVSKVDLRQCQPHPENMRNVAGGVLFGVTLKEDTLDSEELIPSIIAAGGLTEKPVVSKRKDGTTIMLRGHRRRDAISKMLADSKLELSQELRNAISKVDCEVYEGLTEAQEVEMLQDQNSKPYATSQDMVWFWSMLRAGYSLRGLLERILSRKATATDNLTVTKRAEVRELRGKEREKFLYDWFKGSYDYYYKKAYDLGAVTQKAALLTERLREFPKGEMPYFFTAATPVKKGVSSQARIGALVTAANTDRAAGKWNPITGGPEFQKQVEAFHSEDFNADGTVNTAAAPPKPADNRISLGTLKERLEGAKSSIEKAAYAIASGEIVHDYTNAQEVAYALEAKRNHHNSLRAKLPEDKKLMLDIFFNGSIEDFQKAYESLLSK